MSRGQRLIRALVLAALALALFVPVAASDGDGSLGVPGVSEKRLRSFETRTLGGSHAREHARARRVVRHRKAQLKRRAAKLRRMSPSARRRFLRDERRQARLARRAAAGYLRAAATGPPSSIGQWDPAGASNLPALGVHATLLPTGKILYFSYPTSPFNGHTAYNIGNAWLWDPVTKQSKEVDPPLWLDPATNQMVPANIWCAGQTLLADGRVLVAGGNVAFSSTKDWQGLNKVYTFNPFNETWTEQPDMRHGRWYPTTTTLPDGRVMIMSGRDETGGDYATSRNKDIELFTPSSNMNGVGTVTLVAVRGQSGMPPDGAYYPHVFVMPSGRSLVAGPEVGDSWFVNSFGSGTSFSWTDAPGETYRYWNTAVILPGGTSGSTKVMQIGGADNGAKASTTVFDEANSGAGWQAASSMQIARAHHNTVLLPDGSMVTVGGGVGQREPEGQFAYDTNQLQVELWDPVAKTWTLGPSQAEGRAYHSTALLLPDGRVVSAGDDFNGAGGPGTGWDTDTAEFYSPPYLFKGARPTITAAPTGVAHGAVFNVDTPDTNVTKAALVSLGATTHANDMNQRHVPLALTPRTGGVTLTAPPNANVAPPGYYMLFLLNSNGVPSIARMVQVGGPGSPPPPIDSTPPAKPATPTATPGDATAAVSLAPLNNEPDLASYTLERKKTSDGASFWAPVKTGITSWPQTDTGLVNATSYDYRVVALDSTGNPSTPSDPVSVTPNGPPPPPPGAGYASTVGGTAGLQGYWRFGDASGTTAAAAYGTRTGTYAGTTLGQPGLLTGDTDKAVTFAGTAKVTFGDAFDFSGTAFAFSLEAWVKPTTVDASARRIFSKETSDAAGVQGYYLINTTAKLQFARLRNGVYEVVNGPVIPAGTTKHVVVTYDGTTIRLYVNGAQVASDPSPAALLDTTAQFTVGAKASGGGNWAGTIDEPAVYNTVLSPATISAHFTAGSTGSPPPPQDTTPPAKPATPTATPGNGSASINLSPLNSESDLASYTLQRKLSSQPVASFANVQTGILTWPQTNAGLTNGTSYDYRVIAVDSSGNPSTASDPVSVTPVPPPDSTPPAKPATPTATPGNGAAVVNLSPLNTEPDLASYTLQRKRSSDPVSSFASVQTGITTWPQTNAGLTNGISYDYRVVAVDTSGNPSLASDVVSVTPVEPPPPDSTPPAKPSTPTATAGNGSASINLPIPNSEVDLASYTLERKLTSASDTTYAAVKTGFTTWPQSDTGLTNGTSYSYRVIAVDTSGNPSTPSDAVSVTPVAPPDTTPPAKPATPTATPGNGSASINLSPVNTEPDLASYTLERKLTSASDTTYAAVKTGFTTWPQTDTGLTNGTSYSYRVIAIDNSTNPSTPSNAVAVTPAAPPAGYQATVTATAGLSGYWRFADATGTTAAATTGLVTGTYGAGTTLNQPGLLVGDANKAVTLAGTAKVTFGDVFDFTARAPYSLEAWVKPTIVDASARRIFSKEVSAGAGYYLISNSTRLQFARVVGSAYDTINGPKLTVGSTYHVVVTYDGTSQVMYVNGAQVALGTSTRSLADSTIPFTVGAKSAGGGNWAGTIDEPAVYTSALSAATVLAHYRSGTGT